MDVRRGRSIVAGIGSLLAVLAFAPVGATAGTTPRASAAPVLTVATSRTLNCSIAHRDDPRLRFFADTSCATIVVVGGKVFGPALTPGFFPDARPTAFTPISQSARTGSGTAADPWRVVTKVAAGTTGVRIQQVDTWTSTSEVVQTRLDVANDARAPQRVVVWRAGDCQADSFESFGRVRAGKAACLVSAQDGADRMVARPVPGPQLMMFAGVGSIPQIGINGGFGPFEVARRIMSGAAPSGGCEQCNESIDRVLAIGWPLTIAARTARTLHTSTTVSSGGSRAASGLIFAPPRVGSSLVSARLFSLGLPVRGAYVRFLRDGSVVCVAITDAAGRAACDARVRAPANDAAGAALGADPIVTAMYDGDLDRRPAAARLRLTPDPARRGALARPACGQVTSQYAVLDYIAPSPGHGGLPTAVASCSTIRFGFWDGLPGKGGHLLAYVPGDGTRDLTVWTNTRVIPSVVTVSRFRQPDVVLQQLFVLAVSPGKFRS
jgi:hypothetical protein